MSVFSRIVSAALVVAMFASAASACPPERVGLFARMFGGRSKSVSISKSVTINNAPRAAHARRLSAPVGGGASSSSASSSASSGGGGAVQLQQPQPQVFIPAPQYVPAPQVFVPAPQTFENLPAPPAPAASSSSSAAGGR